MVSFSKKQFHIADYVIFAAVLLISAAIGVYHACASRRKQTTADVMMAGRSMHFLPVSLSILASFFSASTLLGTPAEIYLRGTQYWISVFGAIWAPVTGAFLFGPFFKKLQVISVFEYLTDRYGTRTVRIFGAAIFILRLTLGMGIVLFGPSVALNAVTGFPVWAGIVLVGAVCTFYTSVGGIKAVIWTDVFQTLVMLCGMLAVIIRGTMRVGGMAKVWQIAHWGKRIEFFNFDPDPTVRHTFWSLIIGNYFGWLYPYTVDQQMIQRFAASKNTRHAKLAVLCNVPGMFILISLCCLAGLVMYAFYHDCDPLKAGVISDPNQLLPYFVMDVLGFLPGLPGLFMAAIFSGALSSVSSMQNSLAAVTWEDFFKLHPKPRAARDSAAAVANKLLAAFYGGVAIAMAFLVSKLGGTVLQMSITFNGSASAPLLGIFLLGTFCPCANWIGAVFGGVVGFALSMWISIGAYVTKPPVLRNLPRNMSGCPFANTSSVTAWTTTTLTETTVQPTTALPITGVNRLYMVSYLWVTAIGTLTAIFVGICVSFLSGYTRPKSVKPHLLISLADRVYCCLPECCKRVLRCYISNDQHIRDGENATMTEKHKTVQEETQNGGNIQIKTSVTRL